MSLGAELRREGRPIGYLSFLTTPEKALLDWCWLAEENGLYPRLDEMEWAELDLGRLDLLAAAMGISYRRLLAPASASRHDQERLRADAFARLR